jgi:hypothetical protein
MAEGIKQGFVSEDQGTKKAFLYKPFERKKQAWAAMVQNLIVKNTNEELTSALKRMSEAEEIPLKWNKINKPKFMVKVAVLKSIHYNNINVNLVMV